MPRTIDQGFRDFLTKLTPTAGETQAAKDHRASIEARLKRDFDLLRFFRSGSFGNGTSISGYSDVDYVASIPTNKLKSNSSVSLREVKESLAARFPKTGVMVDCPAVVVPFGLLRKETTEVVPADFVEKSGSHHVYDIPDCNSGWMRASPEAHTSYVASVDKKLGGKVRPLIRFIKAWKYYRNVPIASFYLELRITKYAEGESTIIYDIDVAAVFRHLDTIRLAAITDPLGISGSILPCRAAAQLTDAKSKLATALTRASNARAAAGKGNTKEAFDWWNLLYDGKFPSYYL